VLTVVTKPKAVLRILGCNSFVEVALDCIAALAVACTVEILRASTGRENMFSLKHLEPERLL